MIRNLLKAPQLPDHTAVINGSMITSYQSLSEKATAIQVMLLQKRARTTAIFLPNGGDYIAAFFGVLMSAAVALPIYTGLTDTEFVPILKQCEVDTLITSQQFQPLMKQIQTKQYPSLHIIYIEEIAASALLPKPLPVAIDPHETMILLATSGTTGNSKIVMLSEKNVETAVLGYLAKMNFPQTSPSNPRYLLATPFSTVYGIMILSACIIQSFPLVLIPEKFTLQHFYQTVEQYKVTHYEGGAAILQLLEHTIGRPHNYNISSLNSFHFGGSKVSAATLKKLLIHYPSIGFWQGYGMTEAAPLITKHSVLKDQVIDSNKLESVGTAINEVTIAIDHQGTIHTTPYQQGEIIIKGPNVMSGYYKNTAATKQVLKNGYLYTGDMGYLDEEGYLYLCGRKKNIMIIRGLNVYPEEVETCLFNSLLVKDCIVYSAMDEWGNEMICADIVPIHSQITVEELKNHLRIHLSDYKQPQKIELVTVIPKVLSGKNKRPVKQ